MMLEVLSWIKLNYEHICSTWYKWITVCSFIVGSFFQYPSFIKDIPCLKPIILIVIGFLIFFGAVIYLYRKRSISIWKKGNGSIDVCYDDLFKIALKDTNEKKFIVIPVNSTFDIIVNEAGTTQPLVSSTTLHGKWLTRCSEWGLSLEDIDEQIKKTLSDIVIFKSRTRSQKKKGKLQEYPIGTIVPIKGSHNTIFLLTALSAFDEKNNAQSTSENLSNVIRSIVKYIDENGQGEPLYLPVMGTGLSRMNLEKNEAFHLIKYELLASSLRIHEKITIVIYSDSKNEISICD